MHNTRIGFLPFRQLSALSGNTISQPQIHQLSLQNLIIGDGMMTFRTSGYQQQNQHLQKQHYGHSMAIMMDYHSSLTHHIAKPSTASAVTWDSAGTIVIEDKYHDSRGATHQAIFLGLNPSSSKYELFYGKRDASDSSPIETAQRECSEETSNLFRFSSGIFDETHCVVSPNKKHQAYVIRVQPFKHGIQSKIFYQNYYILKTAGAPYSWTELVGITRISIKEAISSGILNHPNKSDFTMFDVYGNPITIFCRDAEFIRDAIKAKMNVFSPVHTLRFIKSYDDKFNGNMNRFLNTTSCYMA
jgi:hypothetical protein